MIFCTAPLPARSIGFGRKTVGNIPKWNRPQLGEIILDKVGIIAEERHSTLAPSPGVKYGD